MGRWVYSAFSAAGTFRCCFVVMPVATSQISQLNGCSVWMKIGGLMGKALELCRAGRTDWCFMAYQGLTSRLAVPLRRGWIKNGLWEGMYIFKLQKRGMLLGMYTWTVKMAVTGFFILFMISVHLEDEKWRKLSLPKSGFANMIKDEVRLREVFEPKTTDREKWIQDVVNEVKLMGSERADKRIAQSNHSKRKKPILWAAFFGDVLVHLSAHEKDASLRLTKKIKNRKTRGSEERSSLITTIVQAHNKGNVQEKRRANLFADMLHILQNHARQNVIK